MNFRGHGGEKIQNFLIDSIFWNKLYLRLYIYIVFMFINLKEIQHNGKITKIKGRVKSQL